MWTAHLARTWTLVLHVDDSLSHIISCKMEHVRAMHLGFESPSDRSYGQICTLLWTIWKQIHISLIFTVAITVHFFFCINITKAFEPQHYLQRPMLSPLCQNVILHSLFLSKTSQYFTYREEVSWNSLSILF